MKETEKEKAQSFEKEMMMSFWRFSHKRNKRGFLNLSITNTAVGTPQPCDENIPTILGVEGDQMPLAGEGAAVPGTWKKGHAGRGISFHSHQPGDLKGEAVPERASRI